MRVWRQPCVFLSCQRFQILVLPLAVGFNFCVFTIVNEVVGKKKLLKSVKKRVREIENTMERTK